jgi:hypothetical protein
MLLFVVSNSHIFHWLCRAGSCDQYRVLLLVVSNSRINLLLSDLSLVEVGPGHVISVDCFYWWSATVGSISYCQIYRWLRPDQVMWPLSSASIGGQQLLDKFLIVRFITGWGRTGSCDQCPVLLLAVSNSWINLLRSALSLVEAGPGHVISVECCYWGSAKVG